MKTYKTVTEQVEKVVVDSVVCNMCGRDVTFDIDDTLPQHAVTIKVVGEYRHKVIDDMTVQWIDLCEECLSEVLGRLKIKPTSGLDVSWYRPEKESQEVEFSKRVEK